MVGPLKLRGVEYTLACLGMVKLKLNLREVGQAEATSCGLGSGQHRFGQASEKSTRFKLNLRDVGRVSTRLPPG